MHTIDEPQFPAGVRTNKKKEKCRKVSLGGKGEFGRQFSEGWTYLVVWLVAVAGVCSVVELMQPREPW
jgi:hypothetical protein